MKQMIKGGKKMALSFHMNWNDNKVHKREFLEQMGDWYIRDVCAGEKTVASILAASDATDASSTGRVDLTAACCVAGRPIPKCHYRDKPSIVPCRDKPPFQGDKAKSFW